MTGPRTPLEAFRHHVTDAVDRGESQPITEQPARQLGLGARVLYRGAWGTRPPALGTITGWGPHKGETVWDVRLDTGETHWGYDDQFEVQP